MKLKDLFNFIIEQGMRKDPRGEAAVRELLTEEKERYNKLSDEEKADYDTALLANPYADSRLLNGTGDEEIGAVIAGIDMEVSEILLADTLRSRGKKIDAIVTHHPEGKAYATFYEVMGMQSDIMAKFGVPITAAESLTDSRMREVGRSVKSANHHRSVDAAKLLNFPFFSAHTVADNQVATFLQDMFDEKKPKYVGDVLKLLKEIPEYKEAAIGGAGPCIFSGSKENRAGKVFVDMTGGTEGAKDLLEKLADAGVGTIVGMHMSSDHYKMAEKHHIHVVIAGHISSDNLGMNLLFDAAEKQFGHFDVIECSGFRRIRRS